MWRSRVEGRPADSIKQFHRHLRVLNGTEPHGYSRTLTANPGSLVVTAPMSYRPTAGMRPSADLRRRRTIERRRNVLFTLVGVAAGTLLLGVVGIKMMLMFHLITDLLLVAYVGLLIRLRSMAAERDMKLRYLPTSQAIANEDVTAWGDLTAAYAAQ
jgi:hypothetical protein